MLADIPKKFQAELNPGEQVIWSGQPKQGFILRPTDVLMIPISLMWGGFAIFWESAAIAMSLAGKMPFPISLIFPLFGLPFVLFGLYLIFGRFFFDKATRSKTYYALTGERIIIISGLRNQNIKSIDFKNLSEVNISTKSNGPGTITFGATHPWGWFYAGGGFPNPGRPNISPSFEMIEDAKTVYQHIKRLQREDE
jgi:hypothetical protein